MNKVIYIIVLFNCCLYASLLSQPFDSLKLVYQNAQTTSQKIETGLTYTEILLLKGRIDAADTILQEVTPLLSRAGFIKNQYTYHYLYGKLYQKKEEEQKADSLFTIAMDYATNTVEKVDIWVAKAGYCRVKGRMEEVEELLRKSHNALGEDTLNMGLAKFYVLKSVLVPIDNAFLRLRYLLLARERAVDNPVLLITINYNTGIVYEIIGELSKAKKQYQETYRISKQQEDAESRLFSLWGLANVNIALKDYEASKMASREAIAFSGESGIKRALGFPYSCLGNVAIKEAKLDSAIYFLEKGAAISAAQQELKELGDNYELLALALFLKKDFQRAKFYAEQANDLKNYQDPEVYDILSKIYKEEGSFEKALIFANKRANYFERINANRSNYKVASTLLKEQLQTEWRQGEKALRNQLRQQGYIWGLTILSFLLLAFLFFSIFQKKNNQRLSLLNESLAKRNNDLQQFAYITSHDLKEPLRNISSFTSLLSRKQEFSDEEKSYLNFIRTNANTLDHIVDSIRTYTEISLKEIERKPIQIQELFTTIRNNLAPLITTKEGVLLFHDEAEIDQIIAPNYFLKLLLEHLIQNGFKYNEHDHPLVEVYLKREKEQLLFLVKDNGIGIEEQYQDYIFRPFKTLQNKSMDQSSGLGLAICKDILDRMGEKIWMESIPGKGTDFYFTLSKF